MSHSNLEDIEVQIIHMTEKAIKFSTDGVDEHWLPFSQCELLTADPRGLVAGVCATLTAEQFVLEEKGIV